MKESISFLLFSKRRKLDRADVRPSRLQLEALEDRQLLSATDLSGLAAAAELETTAPYTVAGSFDVEPISLNVLNTSATKLATPTGVGYEAQEYCEQEEGVVKVYWNKVANAENYIISYSGAKAGNAGSTTLSAIYNDVSFHLSPDTYRITIQATASGYTSSSLAVLTDVRPDYPLMASPQGLVAYWAQEDPCFLHVGWEAVDGACEYKVLIETSDENCRDYDATTTDTGYTCEDIAYDANIGLVTVSVTALSAGSYHDSEPSVVTLLAYNYYPADPNPQVASKTGTSVTLTWTGDEYAIRYDIYNGDDEVASVDAGNTTYTVTGLSPCTEYTFRVDSKTDNWIGTDGTVTVTTDKGNLATPTLKQTVRTDTSATISWDAVANATDYVVSYTVDGSKKSFTTSATSGTFAGLSANSSYSFSVTAQATNYYDSSAATITATTDKALVAPTNLKQTTRTSTSATISWGAVTNAEKYVVSYTIDGAKKSFETTGTSYTLTGLALNSSYSVAVYAARTNYNNSAAASITATTDKGNLAAPANFKQTARTDTSVSLAWDKAANATKYVVSYTVDGSAKTFETTDTTCVLSGLSADSSYPVSVVAVADNYYDSSASTITATTDMETLATPGGVVLQDISKTSVTWQWNAVANAEKYEVSYVVDGQTITGETTDTTYTMTGLTEDTTYPFSVVAKANGYNDSAAASSSCFTYGGIDITVENVTSTSVTTSWDAIEGASWYLVAAEKIGGKTVSDSTSGTTYAFNGLEPNSDYKITIWAMNDNVKIFKGNVAYVTTELATLSAPTNLTQSGRTDSSVTVAWDSVTNAEKYAVSWTVDGVVKIDETTDTSYTITDLAVNSTYSVSVGAKADDYYDSALASTDVTTDLGTLAAVNVVVSGKTTDSITLSWDAVPNAEFYEITYATSTQKIREETTATTFTATDLLPGTPYSFAVYAIADDYYGSEGFAYDTTNIYVPAPTNVEQTGKTYDSVTLEWDAAEGATSYVLSWRVDGQDFSAETSDTFYTATGLAPETTYSIGVATRIAGYNENNDSEYVYCDATTDKGNLAAPANLVQDSVTDSSVTIKWDSVANATNYRVSYTVDGQAKSFETADTTYTADGLNMNTAYTFSVVALADNYYDSTASTVDVTTDKGNLAAPTNLVQDSVTDSSVTVKWDSVTNATNYRVSYTVDGQATSVETSDTTYTIDGLSPNTAYTFNVVALADNYYDSPASTIDVTTDKGNLAAPANLVQDSVTYSSATLKWDSVTNATNYRVSYTVDGQAKSFETADTTYTADGLSPNTAYTFSIVALADNYYDSPASTIDATTDKGNLLAPTNLAADSVTYSSATLKWDSVANATNYRVSYTVDGQEKSIETSATTYTADGLNMNTAYTFSVVAIAGDYYDSTASTVDVTTDKGNLAAPANLAADSVTDSSVTVKWDSVANATNYRVSYTVDGQATSVETSDTTYTIDGLSMNTSYTFSVVAIAGDYYDSLASTVDVTTAKSKLATPQLTLEENFLFSENDLLTWGVVTNATSYDVALNGKTVAEGITGTSYTFQLDPNVEYTFAVTANNPDYESSVGTLTVTSDKGRLVMPKNFTLDSVTTSSATLSWDAVANAEKYRVSYPSDGRTISYETADTTYTVGGLGMYSLYEFSVTAIAENYYDSSPATIYAARTAKGDLAAAANLVQDSVADSSVTIKWDSVANATEYVVSYTVEGQEKSFETSKTSYTIDGLSALTTYTFSVVAKADNYNDSAAATIDVTTDKSTLAAPANLVQDSVADSSVTIKWDSVTNATNYRVSYTVDGQAKSVETSDTTYTIDGLSANTTYSISVVAVADNYYDSPAATIDATTDMATLEDPYVYVYNATPTEVWIDVGAVDNATNYVVTYEVDGVTVTKTLADAEYLAKWNIYEFHIDGLTPNTAYTFAVEASAEGYYPGRTGEYDFLTPSDIGLVVSETTSSSVTLTWDAVEGATAGYCVVCDGNTTTVADTTYTATGLLPDWKYNVYVYAMNGPLAESWDNVVRYDSVNVNTGMAGVMDAPTNVRQSYATDSEFAISWDKVTNSANMQTRYMVTYELNGETYTRETTSEWFQLAGLEENTDVKISVVATAHGYYDSEPTTITSGTVWAKTLADPTNIKTTFATATSVALKWDAVENAELYRVCYVVDGEQRYVETTDTTCTITGLAPNTTYGFGDCYLVADAEGYNSGLAPLAMQTCADLAFSVDQVWSTSIAVSWDAVDDATSYSVTCKRGDETVRSVSTPNTSEYFSGLDPNTEYTFTFKAIKGSSSEMTMAKATTWPADVATPTNIRVTERTDTSITFAWDPVEGATSYRAGYSGWKCGDSFQTTETTCTITGLAPYNQYTFFAVATCEGYGDSDYAEVSAWPLYPRLDAPTNFKVDSKTTQTAELSWDSVEDAATYKLTYELNGREVVVETANTSHKVEGLDPNACYSFKVEAYADESAERMHSDPATVSVITPIVVKLAAPDLTASSSGVGVTWTVDANAARYLVQYRVDGGTWSAAQKNKTGDWSLANADLSSSYEIRAKAVGDGTNYANSDWSYVTIGASVTPPVAELEKLSKPVASLASFATDKTITWDAVQGAQRYIFGYRVSGTSQWTTISKIKANSITLDALDAGASYDFRVKAVGDGVTAKNSDFHNLSYESSSQSFEEELDEETLELLAAAIV